MKVTITPSAPTIPFDSAAVGSWWKDRAGCIYRLVYGKDGKVGLAMLGDKNGHDIGRMYTGEHHATPREAASTIAAELTPFRGQIVLDVP